MPRSDRTETTNRSVASQDRQAVERALAERPHAFEFFQAVRLLMRVAHRDDAESAAAARPVGHDYPPHSEIVRFRTLTSHSFPPSEISAYQRSDRRETGDGPLPAEMTIAFLGLTGPVGALPQHYTQTILDRLRLKDHALRNFFDLFNHRTISLFYRAWEKHQVLPQLERADAESCEDPFTRAVYALIGMGSPALRNRLSPSDETFAYYAGLLAHYPRNALSLSRMIAELFGLPAAIQQFQGQWLRLEPMEQSALPTPIQPNGLNCRLGATTIAGERVWSVESKFRLRLGPMGYNAFERLLPGNSLLREVAQIVRTYAGPELDFDVQLVLRREDVPQCQLNPSAAGGPRLGWNTWACSVPPVADAEQAVFEPDGRPSR